MKQNQMNTKEIALWMATLMAAKKGDKEALEQMRVENLLRQ